MNILNKVIFLLFCAVFTAGTLAAQDGDRKEELRLRKVRLQDEIDIANKILEEARHTRNASVTALQTLNQKLRIREELMRTIDREIVLMNREISDQQSEIENLEGEIAGLKEKYAQMIRQAYKSRSRSGRLMFILASDDFTQAMRRIQYLRQYSSFRRQQVNQIVERQAELEVRIESLNRQMAEKQSLREQKDAERQSLLAEQSEQKSTIAALRQQEGNLESDIARKQAESDQLESEIQRIIAEEMRLARARAERRQLEEQAVAAGLSKGRDFTDRTSNNRLKSLIGDARSRSNLDPAPAAVETPAYGLTPEAARLARNFEANRGKLPWPVERGIVVGQFGRRPHPANRNITINNPHIEIGTASGSDARAAFDGTVISIIRVPGSPITVVLQHGNYYTHYSNLSDVYVTTGDKVTSKQALGRVFTDPANNETVLEFGLWENDKNVDPSPWLAR